MVLKQETSEQHIQEPCKQTKERLERWLQTQKSQTVSK